MQDRITKNNNKQKKQYNPTSDKINLLTIFKNRNNIQNSQLQMDIFCKKDSRYQQKSDYYNFMNNIEPCSVHSRPTQFICLNKECEEHLLLCVQCITQHRDHHFQKIEKFFTQQKFNTIQQGEGRKHQHFDDMADLVKTKMDEIMASVNKSLQNIKHRIDMSMQRFKSLGIKMSDINQKIDHHMMVLIKSYLQQQWSYIRCQKMKQTFDKVLNSIQDSFVNLTDDLLEFIEEEDWENIEEREFKNVEQEWFSHLHPHVQKVIDYFKFDSDAKATNIKLIAGRLEAEYLRSTPSIPFVVADNFIKEEKKEWVIQIMQCDSKMVFFNASTIYVGVCRPDILKRLTYCRVNEGGRGTYLIGSNGWSYHHTDPSLDRQDIVGFTFGKGDQIHVKVDLRGRGRIKFRKLGKFYDNRFQMSLNMDEKALSRPCLKPCVGFSDEVGVTVRIINLRTKDKSPLGN